jgi:hypothetical protein
LRWRRDRFSAVPLLRSESTEWIHEDKFPLGKLVTGEHREHVFEYGHACLRPQPRPAAASTSWSKLADYQAGDTRRQASRDVLFGWRIVGQGWV